MSSYAELRYSEAAFDGNGFVIGGSRNDIKRNASSDNAAIGIDVVGGANHTEIIGNVAVRNSTFDLADQNVDCSSHVWRDTTFGTRNQECIH